MPNEHPTAGSSKHLSALRLSGNGFHLGKASVGASTDSTDREKHLKRVPSPALPSRLNCDGHAFLCLNDAAAGNTSRSDD